MASSKGIDPNYPTTVKNQNIWKLYTDYQMMLEEIDKSVTKKNAGMLSHDAVRWQSYIAGFRAYTGYWQGKAFLDMPVTHGRNWDISDPLDLSCDFKDNTAACELMALLVSARDELVLSASAELPLHPAARAAARHLGWLGDGEATDAWLDEGDETASLAAVKRLLADAPDAEGDQQSSEPHGPETGRRALGPRTWGLPARQLPAALGGME